MVTEVEYFDVLFSKHLTQKAKTWEDGFLEYHIKGNKVTSFVIIEFFRSFYIREMLGLSRLTANSSGSSQI
jgi:hypothetical protein